MKRPVSTFYVSLALVALVCLAAACAAKRTFKPGQKLSGRYNTIVVGSAESYLFREDGTFEHTGFGTDGKGTETGGYSINGRDILFTVGGKQITATISASKGDADKLSPATLYLGVDSFDLSTTGLAKGGSAGGPDKDNIVPPEFTRYAPVKVGQFARIRVAPYRAYGDDTFKDGIRFIYEANNYIDIKRYGSAAEAQAAYQKRANTAVAANEYDQTVKLPKCDPQKETDYTAPEVLVKRVQRHGGSEAVILQDAKFWDYRCTLTSNRGEAVIWADGTYLVDISTTPPDTNSNAFGKAEAFFNDFEKATAP